MSTVSLLPVVASLAASLSSSTNSQVTHRVSLDSIGGQGNGPSESPSISSDGRFVVFASHADNLVPGDANLCRDVFVHDRINRTIERVSVDSAGIEGDNASDNPSISGDGRFVAFESWGMNLVSAPAYSSSEIFVRDRQTALVTLESVDSTGAAANSGCTQPHISRDGSSVMFTSAASNLDVGDTNGIDDVFVHDRMNGSTERVNVRASGGQADDGALGCGISSDGRYVVFTSPATDLVASDTNGCDDVFVRDRVGHTTERVSLGSSGVEANLASFNPSISSDGRYVAFESFATNLVAGDTNASSDIFVRDRFTGTTTRVSLDVNGGEASSPSRGPTISADGTYVAFQSLNNLLLDGIGNSDDLYLRDLSLGRLERIGVRPDGSSSASGPSFRPALSDDVRFVAFTSYADDLVFADTNGVADVFVRDLDTTAATNLCEPGTGGVVACPCSNPPGATGRGCDNSASTGGARLTASGWSYVSQDTLTLSVDGLVPTTIGLVVQGSAANSIGVPFGQGVRCVGGSLQRLFLRPTAVGGFSVPDPNLGDLAISARSAAVGSSILPGTTRYYFAYYRDAILPPGCSAAGTFNVTQAMAVAWSW